jgi:hypothetical protein
VQSESGDGTSDHAPLHHHGTISADRTGLFDNSWGQFSGFNGGITGFGGIYPSPGFTPIFDPPASASRAHTAEADSDGAISGSNGTIQATQASSDDPPSGFVIVPDYDSSITDLSTSDPTLYAEITGAVTAAIDFYEGAITNPITITIGFGYGELNNGRDMVASGELGESLPEGSNYSYDELRGLLADHDVSAGASALPTTDPLSGSSTDPNWFIADSELLALGTNPGNVVDGYVGLSSAAPFTYDPIDRAVSGEYDAIGVLEHEISEAMGRNADYPDVQATYSPLDLFRYTSAGTLATDGGAAYFSINDGQTTGYEFNNSTLPEAGDAGDWSSQSGDINPVANDSYDAFIGSGAAYTVSPTDLTVMNMLGYTLTDTAPCFLAGTRIATPSGNIRVERLAVGDMVLTAQGTARPIVWVGTGRVLATRGNRGAATPVIVRKGALADNVPARDLRVTKGHALLLDGALIPVEELVNHRSILWDDRAQEVVVYHIELETHDVLLANGAPAESYRDDGNRWLFQNANTGWGLPPKPPCAAVLTSGPIVDAVWRRLLDRAGPRPGLPLTCDPDLHLLAGGARLDAAEQRQGLYVFKLVGGQGDVRIVSRAAIPQELGLARDPRSLGVALRRVTVRGACESRVIEAEDTLLTDGFHAFEADNGFRWTAGDAVLPNTLFAGLAGPVELELHVACIAHYVEDSMARSAA